MHMAGEFGRHLYPGLKETFSETPSINFIEELLRVGGLLHDVGHGPYGHFFDDHFLSQYDLTHEILGQKIITDKLGHLIKDIRRSPSGVFGRANVSIQSKSLSLLGNPGMEEKSSPDGSTF